MTTIAETQGLVIGGVDTHKDLHVGAVLDSRGRLLESKSFQATTVGYEKLLDWMCSFGEIGAVGVEGTGSWGAGLGRFLASHNIEVVEVNRPNRQRRRLKGKSDATDAEAADRQVLSGEARISPRGRNGQVESIRLIRMVRRSAIQSRTQTANQIHGLIDTAVDEKFSSRFKGKSLNGICLTAQTLRANNDLTDPAQTAKFSLKLLAKRWLGLTKEITELDKELKVLVSSAAPKQLLDECGVGTDVAGALLVAMGDNPQRMESEAAFASLCGVSPIDASSGRQVRHRLNRGGDRQANNALWRIVLVRLRYDQATKEYMERRLAEGKTKAEVIRCLKRLIARRIYRLALKPPKTPPQHIAIAV